MLRAKADRLSMTVVCSVAAQQVILAAVNGVSEEERLDVIVTIKRLSDVDNLFEYDFKDGLLKSPRVADLDDLELIENRNTIRTNFGSHIAADYRTFYVEDSTEYQLFKDAVAECRMLSEMTLRLSSLARDIYYAGIYSSHRGEDDDVPLCASLQIIRDQQSDPAAFTVFQLYMDKSQRNGDEKCDIDADHHLSPTSSSSQHHILSEINCVFCGVQKMMEISRDFAVHPYVTQSFNGRNIYMCMPCLLNWKEFREKAIQENQLVLKNEVNEELCGKRMLIHEYLVLLLKFIFALQYMILVSLVLIFILDELFVITCYMVIYLFIFMFSFYVLFIPGICSDTPAELIMCSECPRSFCNLCLLRILNSEEVKELDSLIDWVCMSCRLGLSAAPPLLDNRLWTKAKPTITKRSNNLFNSKPMTSKVKPFIKTGSSSDNWDADFNNEMTGNDDQLICLKSSRGSPGSISAVKGLNEEKEKQSKIVRKKDIDDSPVFMPLDGGLPYLDDFDDGDSDDNDDNENKIDDDEDCNLFITLPAKFTPKKSMIHNLKLPGKPKQIFKKSGNGKKGIQFDDFAFENKIQISQTSQIIKKNQKNECEILESAEVVCSRRRGKGLKGLKGPKGKRGGRMTLGEMENSKGEYLPPVNTAVDEVYYFAQYVQVYMFNCHYHYLRFCSICLTFSYGRIFPKNEVTHWSCSISIILFFHTPFIIFHH